MSNRKSSQLLRQSQLVFTLLFGFVLLSSPLRTALAEEQAAVAGLPSVSMKFLAPLSPQLLTGSQPSAADLAALKAAGVTTVINLRGTGEDAGYDEAAEAARLGLSYVTIPIASGTDVTAENAAKLDQALRASNGTALVHCASSNRAGALLALRSAASGQSIEEAVAFGKSAGMTSLESVVRERLQSQPCNPMIDAGCEQK